MKFIRPVEMNDKGLLRNMIGFMVGLVVGYKGIPVFWHLIYLGVIAALTLGLIFK